MQCILLPSKIFFSWTQSNVQVVENLEILLYRHAYVPMGFPGGSVVKNVSAKQETQV